MLAEKEILQTKKPGAFLSYTKRDKLYSNNNKWINTKPIFVNKIVKDLVIYKQNYLIIYREIQVKKFTLLRRRDKFPVEFRKSYIKALHLLFIYLCLAVIIPVSAIAYINVMIDGIETDEPPFPNIPNIEVVLVDSKDGDKDFNKDSCYNYKHYPDDDKAIKVKISTSESPDKGFMACDPKKPPAKTAKVVHRISWAELHG